MTKLLDLLDFDTEKINSVYDHIEGILADLNMNADRIIDKLPAHLNESIEWYDPTATFIVSLLNLTRKAILTKYPQASVTIIPSKAIITVNDETYELARKEIAEEE